MYLRTKPERGFSEASFDYEREREFIEVGVDREHEEEEEESFAGLVVEGEGSYREVPGESGRGGEVAEDEGGVVGLSEGGREGDEVASEELVVGEVVADDFGVDLFELGEV